MATVAGYFYDGQSSRQIAATLIVAPDGLLTVEREGRHSAARLAQVRLSPRVGDAVQSLYFPDGGTFEPAEQADLERAFALCAAPQRADLVHKLESRWAHIVVLIIVLAGAAWGTIEFGIPAAAERVAAAIPLSVTATLSTHMLASLDRGAFAASTLSPEVQERLRARVAPLLAASSAPATLLFRQGGVVRANAFALPGGEIIVTDQLVELAEHDDEIAGIIAHEIGHVVNRHGLRRMLQGSVLALVIVAFTGDASSLTTIAAGAPTLLLEARYSRDFEREADQYARAAMRAHAIAPARLAEILERLAAVQGGVPEPLTFLSTHPATTERLAALRGADTEGAGGE